jgi:phosphoribosyl 1,2-cyclic phosphodiesterase
MRIQICGARGSVPSPGSQTVRYGGNTSCVLITLSEGTHLVLDAGTGLRNIPATALADGAHIHLLLTHLHLDHIQGLLFFSPLFRADARVTIWGPAAAGTSLRNRIGRYLSAPLTPIEVRELPCELDFRNCPVTKWNISSATIVAAGVTHRGPTLGFRVEDEGSSVCYLPDHEAALAGPIDELEPEWISGYSLAREADLLVHDCQYTDDEYGEHFGWGHSSVSHAVHFAARCEARRTLLFHHDPYHTDDQLDSIRDDVLERWQSMDRSPEALELAAEGSEITIGS